MIKGQTDAVTDTAARTITVRRTYAAPRERVFRAYTDPEHLARWWGPEGWQTETHAHELVPGGVWHYVMRGPDGMESWSKTTYQEVTPPSTAIRSRTRRGTPSRGCPRC